MIVMSECQSKNENGFTTTYIVLFFKNMANESKAFHSFFKIIYF